MNKHKSNKIKENSNTVRHLIMGQITTTQNLVAIKEVRHAGQKEVRQAGQLAGIIMSNVMHTANERPRYNVMSSLIGWVHTQNEFDLRWRYFFNNPSISFVLHYFSSNSFDSDTKRNVFLSFEAASQQCNCVFGFTLQMSILDSGSYELV